MNEQLRRYCEKRASLEQVLSLLEYDTSIHFIKDAQTYNSQTVNILSKELLDLNKNEQLLIVLKNGLDSEDETERNISEYWLKEITHQNEVPDDLLLEYKKALLEANAIWPECKANNDFNAFAPYLETLVNAKKKVASYHLLEGMTLYDVMIDEFTPGFDIKTLDHFFDLLKEKAVPLIHKIRECEPVDDAFLHQAFDIKKQKAYIHDLLNRIGFDFNKGMVDESEHPFTASFNNRDIRITDHYHNDNLNAIFSAIHECGHALYEMDIDDKYARTCAGKGLSTPIHEGQSRFYENMLGRNPLFWDKEYDYLKDYFKDELKDVTLAQFKKAINKVDVGLIRIEADELTYSLHIMLRYEIEKKMINEDIDVHELPALWNAYVKEYLGLDVPDDKSGVLQDIHWGQGYIGYFSGYALGSAVAAQLYEAMKKDIDIERKLSEGNYDAIHMWLKEKVHKYGRSKTEKEIMQIACNEDFDPEYYVNYLVRKYCDLYGIKGE